MYISVEYRLVFSEVYRMGGMPCCGTSESITSPVTRRCYVSTCRDRTIPISSDCYLDSIQSNWLRPIIVKPHAMAADTDWSTQTKWPACLQSDKETTVEILTRNVTALWPLLDVVMKGQLPLPSPLRD